MATKEDIKNEFAFLGLQLSEVVLEKCVELCKKYFLDGESLLERWFAYSASNLMGKAPNDLGDLEKFERSALKNMGNVTVDEDFLEEKNEMDLAPAEEIAVPQATVFTPAKIAKEKLISTPNKENFNRTPRRSLAQSQNSQHFQNNDLRYASSPTNEFESYLDRKDSLSVKFSYGADYNFPPKKGTKVNITLSKRSKKFEPTARYMYDIMKMQASSMLRIYQKLANDILKKNNLDRSEKPRNMGSVVTVGRITDDGGEKINSESVVLEGIIKGNMREPIRVNLKKLKKIETFPGQVLAVKGNNLANNTLVFEEVFCDASLPLPSEPAVTQEPLSLVIAAGPFTLLDNLTYEPLKDLLDYVKDKQPNILILLGPFLQRTHPCIQDRRQTLKEDFKSFFEELVESISVALEDLDTQIVIMGSSMDASNHVIYPTPPWKMGVKLENVVFVPDPCVFEVDGLVIGGTTVDILGHLSDEELYINNSRMPEDKMSRLVRHIFQQRNFYPLHPPQEDMSIDFDLLSNHGILDCTPHMMILPSNFRYFAKDINGSFVVNPEKLAKGFGAGTFAHINIEPGTTESISERTSCKILRI